MKLLGLQPEWAMFRDMWRDSILSKRLTLARVKEMDVFEISGYD